MILDRSTSPTIHDAIEFDFRLPPINREQLDNGLNVNWLDAGVQDVVRIDWVFPSGLWYEQRAAVAKATAGMLKSGTKKYTAEQIHESLEFYGAQLNVSAGSDFGSITLYTLTKHLSDLLPVVLDIITDSTFPEDELAIYKRNTIQKLMVHLRECEFVANQQIDAALFGDQHPYGRYSRVDSIEALTQSDIVHFHKSQYNLANAQIFMAGKVGRKEFEQINKVFGVVSLAHNEVEKRNFSVETNPQKVQRISNDPNGVQGAIRIARLFPNRHHPDYTPMVVLNGLLGGYFGSRLMSNIREDKGYTYGIYSTLSPDVNGGTMTIQTEVGTAVLENAIKEVYKEMELLCKEAVSEEELLLVKNYLLGGLLGDLDGPFSILRRWRTLILNGFGEEDFRKNVEIYKKITPTALQALAQKYYNREDFHEVVVV